MSPRLIEHIPKGKPARKRPYLPYLPAVESGLVKPDAISPVQLDAPLGTYLLAGRMPRHSEAGLLELASDVFACDHIVVIRHDRNRIVVGPSSKNAVEKCDGSIKDEGTLSLMNDNGWLRIIGAAVNTQRNPWEAERLQVAPLAGSTAVKLFGLEAYDCEVTSLHPNGVMVAKPRLHYY